MPEGTLNKITEKILGDISPNLPNDIDTETVEVEFLWDQKISYPKYLFDYRGKDLLRAYNQTYEGNVSIKDLIKMLSITKWIANDIVSAMNAIQVS